LAVQWLFRRRLSAGWQYALWFLVVIRLALPILPASSWSVFNIVHHAAFKTAPPVWSHPVESPSLPPSLPATQVIAPPVSDHIESVAAEPTSVPAPRQFDKQRLMRNAAFVWLAGLLLLSGRALVQNLTFWRKVKTAQKVTDAQTLALFDGCRKRMGVSKPMPLAETQHVKSPALYGFFRPTLLLPANVMRHFSLAEQRHIFLHELAHVKRCDLAVHWVATGFRLLHWFNPLLATSWPFPAQGNTKRAPMERPF
jgi:bla regulator protein BlaR1